VRDIIAKIKKRERANRIVFYLDDLELAELKRRMGLVEISNREGFIRKMILQGYMVYLDMKPIQEISSLLRNISGNINQVAKRANECGNPSETDVLDLYDEVSRLKPLIIKAHSEVIRIIK